MNIKPMKVPMPESFVRLTLWVLLTATALAVSVASVVVGDREIWLQILKFFVALLLAMIPGWIYLLFIRNKGPSLYDEYVLNLFRLKIDAYENLPAPPQHTNYYELWSESHKKVTDYLEKLAAKNNGEPVEQTKDNLYRRKFEAIYGRGSVSTRDLLDTGHRVSAHTETFSPVLLATILVCLGWVLILPPHTGPLTDLEGNFPGLNFEALKFAFFGAYAFTLLDLVRRYFRDDLRAGAYIGLVVRIVFVALVMTVAAVLLEDSPLTFDPPGAIGAQTIPINVLAFVIGFFPQAGLQLLIDSSQRVMGLILPTLRTTHPLSEIDGLNIWYETRLTEEGIDDMQNLTSANIVDLMLKTRAPIARLIDWMDQGYLALHVWPTNAKQPNARRRTKRSSSVRGLRGLGIRTATDLERVWSACGTDPVFRRLISNALGVAKDEGAPVVEAVLAGLKGETNLEHIRKFRTACWLEELEPAQGVRPGQAPPFAA